MKDYTDLSIADLTNLLKNRNLATDGTKDTLVSRLEAYDAVNDPSPSPELHHSPVTSNSQTYNQIPSSIPNHLPNELDEEYCLNWDDDNDADDVGSAKADATAITAEDAKATKAIETAKAGPQKTTQETPVQSKSEPNPAAGGHSPQTSVGSIVTPPSVDRVSKTGYKYKSIAALHFPDSPKTTKSSSDPPSAAVPKSSPNALPKALSKPPSAVSTNSIADSLRSTLSATPAGALAKAISKPLSSAPSNALSRAPTLPTGSDKPLSSAPSNALSKAPALPTEGDSTTATPITAALATVPASPKVAPSNPTSTQTAATAVALSKENTAPRAATAPLKETIAPKTAATLSDRNPTPANTTDSNHLRTTKSGYKFNSIASLFSTSTSTATARPPPAESKPQPIANMVVDTASTYATDVKLTPKEEEARKLAIRASRFGTTTKETETPAAINQGKKHGRSEQSGANDARERERKLEIERERERERIRQRVTSSGNKRQRNDDNDDRRQDNQYRRNRQSHYRSQNSYKSNYNPRRRY